MDKWTDGRMDGWMDGWSFCEATAVKHGTSNAEIMGLIPSEITLLEHLQMYVFNVVYISSDKSICQMHKCQCESPQRVAENIT